MTVNIDITKELKAVEKLIKSDINKEKTILGLYNYIFKSDGKKIRSRLNLIASSSSKNSDRYKLASIIELLHTATLVHDDVVDNASTRRGAISVNSLWSNAHGVLIGDYIYSKAFMLMVEIGKTDILAELADATNDISQGELIQLDAISNIKISLNKLKKISYFKTGRLFEASAKTGAMLAGANKNFIKNISESAKNIGILFQIKDDLLDYSNSSKTGKQSFQDLKEGKITYPFFFALKNSSQKEKKQLISFLGNKRLNEKKALALISKLNGLIKTQQLAEKFYTSSINTAKTINNQFIRQEMIELANIALNREK
uniref:Predicted geranylgeranyl pyrophosphate synthase n=1 Tax=uncultured marine gamma proteobacterium EBAC20E09 TaxID=266134 RepID=Q6Q8V5_9GAMM|nr:predicted geranylgeranyl pyrophosphate synthase [uncultured marine gamma proteobacterium EBAC20E09]